MKILVATDQWSPDVVGGSARVAADTARALARRGHEVVALAPAHPGRAPIQEDDGVAVHRVLHRGPFPQTFADPLITLRHSRVLRNDSFDVLVAHQTTNAAGLLAARLGAPLAFVFHASAVLEMQFLRQRLGGMRRVVTHALEPTVALLERIAIRRASGILVLSLFSRDLLVARHPQTASRLHIVGGGTSDAFFVDHRSVDECRRRLEIPHGVLLLTSRRLEPRMGVDALIDALALIDDDRVVLAVAGSGRLRNDLDRRVHELGLERRVRLLGRVSEADLRSLYAAADLFVLPTVAYEGFGMSTVEALAAGTPTLGTSVGATPEIVGKLGPEFVVRAADPPVLAEAIQTVIPLLGPDLRARARRVAEAYRWDAAIVAWEDALVTVARR